MMMASVLPLLGVIAAIGVLAATGNLFSSSPLVIAVQAAAVALNVWARVSFRKGEFRVAAAPGGSSLIRNGPFRFVRHPMYAALLLFIWASVFGHLSVLTVGIGVAVTAVAVARVVTEERLLRARFPDCADYAHATKALVPYVY